MEDRYEDGLQVLLNVYDVTSTPGDPKSTTVRLNRITRELGLGGVFHGAIQIGATAQLGSPEPVEFSFGWCERGTGVYAVHACQNPMYQFRETISLGSTPKSMEQVRGIIQELKLTWPGHSYDLLTRNCCHFCEDLAARLQVAPVPGWLNRFAVGAAATVSMTQETVKTVQEIGQELGRLSGESLSFLKASWQRTVAAASQQQQQLSERLQQQQWLRQQREQQQQQGPGGSRSTPQVQQPAGLEGDGWQQQQHRSASEACMHGADSSSRDAAGWLPAGPSSSSSSSSSSAALAAGAAGAGQSLLAGFSQGGRQLKSLTSRLGARLMQQQQQHNAAADASLQEAAAGPGRGHQAAPGWQQQEQQQPGYTGMSPADYLQLRSTQQQLAPPAPQQQQQPQALGGGLLPAVQPKLAPQYCLDGPDAAADPLASLLLDDAEPAAAGAAGGAVSADVAAASSSQYTGEAKGSQQQQSTSTALQAGPAQQREDVLG
uniref:PPPDE domain-containing protein n=1 Tax=Tetradesmus obliquus TaxID=3088 RepID=A0A383W0G7_TETOB|eukprot:jgi/Sobl393_1/19480/SZX71175.1